MLKELMKCTVTTCQAYALPTSVCLLCNVPVFCASHQRVCTGCEQVYCGSCVVGHRQCAFRGCLACCEDRQATDCETCFVAFCQHHANADTLYACHACGVRRCELCRAQGKGHGNCATCLMETTEDFMHLWL
jgi:hypothetical protein